MYAARDDLIARFGVQAIESLEKTVSKVVDPAVSDKALSDATELADSYIAARYGLPLSGTPESLKGYVLDIARYKLYVNKAPDEVRQRYEDAMSWLNRVSSGKVILQLPANPDAGTDTSEATKNRSRVAVGVSHYGGVFGKEVTDLMPMIPPGGFGGFDG
ncbi:gp436 family protein [Alkanindiges illinoisensis]|uniref:gp436 family protein n=1 Tax=Alkanindiges illinoisensis TaxID=197183 RepID=UPI000479ABDC|nr:DUF1320 domain-containing protein [Alkanindiges illinoisensis]